MIFSEQMARIYLVTGACTQIDLADCLSISQASVSDAKRRSEIPAAWFLVLARSLNVNSEWILTGKGEKYLEVPGDTHCGFATAQEAAEALEAVRRLPSKMLADELLRRIAAAESGRFLR